MENVKKWVANKNNFTYSTILAQISIYILLSIQSIISAQYKIAHVDASFFVYNLCAHKTFFVPCYRYVAIFVEYLPLLGIYLGLQFKYIAILYSFNFVFSSFVLYLIFVIYTKRFNCAWGIVLVQIFGLMRGYNHLIVEQFGYTVIVFIILMLDYILEKYSLKKFIVFSVILLIFILINHVFLFTVLYVGFTYLIYNHKYHRAKLILLLLIITSCYFIFKVVFSFDGYEQGKIDLILQNLKEYRTLDRAAFRQYFDIYYKNNNYIKLVFIFSILLGLYYKKYTELVLFVIFGIVTYYTLCVVFYKWETAGYMEIYGMAIFASALIGMYFMTKGKNNNYLNLALFLTIAHISFQNIYSNQKLYRDREIYIHQWTIEARSRGVSKMYINRKYFDYQKLLLDWALPYESMNSCLYRGEKPISLFPENDSTKILNLKPSQIISSVSLDDFKDIDTQYYKPLIGKYYIYK